MKKIVIEDNVVTNIILSDDESLMPYRKGVNIGQLYDSENDIFYDRPLTPEEQEAKDLWEATEYQRLRKGAYPNIGDQLDAIWKEINYRRLNGDNLTQDADEMLGKILAVKREYPR